MNDSTKNARANEAALKDALVAEVWAMTDAEVRAEAQALGVDLEAISTTVGAARVRANAQINGGRADKVVLLDGNRARAIVRRVAARHRLPQTMRLVADLHAPTDAEALEAVQKLDALGLLSDEDIKRSDS